MSEAPHVLLDGLRVVDFSSQIAGPYATKLLADAGADVVKVESIDGDPLRRWTASGSEIGENDGALFRYLNASKRSVVGTVSSSPVSDLLQGCELVVESGELGSDDLRAIRGLNPHATVVSITPFGREGPWAGRPATEFTLQALCGSTAGRGATDHEPVAVGGRLGEWIAGTYGAVASLAAVHGARRRGEGDRVDVSILECMTATLGGFSRLHASLSGNLDEAMLFPGPFRSVETPSVERTKDGLVGFCTVTGQQFLDFLVLIERTDLMDDDRFAAIQQRMRHEKEFTQLVTAWTEQRTTAEIVEQASLLRIPVAPIGTPETIQGFDHFVARDVYIRHPDGDFAHPRVPYRISGMDSPPFASAPRHGQHSAAAAWKRPSNPYGDANSEPERPLAGVRIVDLTAFWAGPAATQMLAALGAEVIKVESAKRPDGMRFNSVKKPNDPSWWEWSAVFQSVNTDKRDLTLDLSDERGVRILMDLISHSDAVIENFSPRVLDDFGITWEAVHSASPGVIMLRMPGFGLDGPWRDRTGFAQTMEQISGMAWMTGFEDGLPVIPRGVCDPLAGMHAVFAFLGALAERGTSNNGRFVEISMVEPALNVVAELVIEYSAYGVSLGRCGNRGPVACPQGVYACQGEEQWLALAVTCDAQWIEMQKILGNPRWGAVPDLADESGRRLAHDQIDGHLASYFSECNLERAVESLVDAGIPAARVLSPLSVLDNAQMLFRRFAEEVRGRAVGTHELTGIPFTFESVSGSWYRRGSPTLGQDNYDVLSGILGVPDSEIAALAADGIIGNGIPT